MKTKTTLLWCAAILLVVGFVALDPTLGFMLFCLATLISGAVSIVGKEKTRLFAVLIFLASLYAAYVSYPASVEHSNRYMDKVRNQSAAPRP